MAYTKVTTITSWSFSRYNTHKKCPALAKYKFIDKLVEPTNEPMLRGTAIHKLAEDYIKGLIRNIPKELKLFETLFKFLRAEYKKKTAITFVEDSWAFRNDWTKTVYNDWNGCWLRVKLDCAHHENDLTRMIISDWKTGKMRPDQTEEYLEQLELYALSAFKLFPQLEEVLPRLVYLDTGDIYPPENDPIIYTRADVKRLDGIWAKRVKPMMTEKRFLPKPNNNCRWCHFRKDNAGPCKF